MGKANVILIKKPDHSKMCNLGYHVVSGHHRVCRSGAKTWVDTHLRKNRSKLIMHLEENLLFLYWNNSKKYQNIGKIKGYSAHNELDSIIQFWLDYLKQNGENFPDDLTALHVKTLIAIESSFNPNARPKTSSARGLMQILDPARNALKGTANVKNNEVRSNYIDVTAEQIEDPVVNIAVGTRWLAHKYFLLRNQKDKSLKQVLRNYYSKTPEGDEYAEKILDLYEKSR